MTEGNRDVPAFVPRVGDVVAGRYRIEAILGQGGFGVVFHAQQLALGRSVALKMLLPEAVQQDEGLSRFRREAQLAQRLEHPNTVRLYDFGQTELGLPYIAFELLRGRPLDEAIHRQGPMSPSRVVRIGSQVLKSLMEAHGLGIIHRDIKPANIFLCDITGEQDFVKVLDFGIAKSTTTNATVLTQAGLSLGTPPYMSPEQVRGDALTPASDLFSLGLMMAELLTGRLVFQGSGTEVFMEQLSPRPVPLPESLRFSPLFAILSRATEKDLGRRYRSADEMLRDLEALAQSGGLGAASSAPPPYAPAAHTELGFGPPPQAIAPRTMPATRMPGAVAPRSPSRWPLFALLGFIALLGVVAVVLLAARSGSGADDDEPKKKKNIHAVDDGPAKKKAKVDPADPSLKGRLTELGWKVIGESNTKTGDTNISTCTVQKGTQMAFVYLYDMPNAVSADAIESSLKSQKGSAYKRDGNRVLWVLTSPPDVPVARRIATDLEP